MTADKRAPSVWIGAEIEPSIGGARAYAASCMNRNIAAAVADQLALLQHARGFGDADLLGR